MKIRQWLPVHDGFPLLRYATIGPEFERRSGERVSPNRVDPSPHAIEYSRRLYENVLGWYEAADRKAQVILASNGTFLTVLAGLLLGNPAETKDVVRVLGLAGGLSAAVFALGVTAAIASAIFCLHSRLLSTNEIAQILREHRVSEDGESTYDAAVLWFFQLVGQLERAVFERRLARVDALDEIEALADQTIRLATRVESKHRWLNLGFASTGLGLLALLVTAGLYVVRV